MKDKDIKINLKKWFKFKKKKLKKMMTILKKI